MGVSSVTHFEGIIRAKTLVFIGVLATFSRPASSLTFFALIPHTFHWKNVTLFRPFRPKGDRWGEG